MAKYKTSKGYHIRLDAVLLESPAYRDLKPVARALLFEFALIYRPTRNGNLSISTRKAAELTNCNEDTASNAFHELAEHGFIRVANMESWTERKAREWAVTWQPVNNHEPTNDWKAWTLGANMCPLPLRKIKSPIPNKGADCPKRGGRFAVSMGKVHTQTA